MPAPLAGWAFLIVAAGCAPSLPPFVTAETADVLSRGRVAVSIGSGAAVLTSDARTLGLCCGGGQARVRVGAGAGREFSLDAAVATTGEVSAWSSRLGGKLALRDWLAFTAGSTFLLHVYSLGKQATVGGDLGLLASTPPGAIGPLQVYGGGRAGIMVPALVDPLSGSGLITSLALPAGVAWHATAATRVYLEGGGVTTRTWYRGQGFVDSYRLTGAYGALALAVIF